VVLAQKTSYAPFSSLIRAECASDREWRFLTDSSMAVAGIQYASLYGRATRLWQIFGRSEDDMEMSGYPKCGRCESEACRAYSAMPVNLSHR
jgi:hypothetical protein